MAGYGDHSELFREAEKRCGEKLFPICFRRGPRGKKAGFSRGRTGSEYGRMVRVLSLGQVLHIPNECLLWGKPNLQFAPTCLSNKKEPVLFHTRNWFRL